ncbi:MAG: hypothetical protein K5695_14785 [Oscillospiraceae bacterium]|nr:hypothetical protein [Oscillospiraceae bacterium]
MKTAIIKLIIQLLTDEKTRRKLLIAIASILVGALGMLLLPVVALHIMSQMEPPELGFDESAFMEQIDTERMAELEQDGDILAESLIAKGLRRQIMKAQLLYLSCFPDGVENMDAYADCFATADDAALIDRLNEIYGLEIDYTEFERTYKMVQHVSIDPYLLESPKSKIAADLAAWCRNAYEAEWISQGGHGELNAELQRRTADNLGLILGYKSYDPGSLAFRDGYNLLVYSVQGGMDSLPDVPGVGVYSGSAFGVYVGDGQVVFACDDCSPVQMVPVTDPRWTCWVTFEDILYPQEMWEYINKMNAPKEPEQEEE